MGRGGTGLVMALAVCGAGACGGGASAPRDGSPADAGDASDAALEVPLVCPDAAPLGRPDAATPMGPMTCGGEVAVAGPTPYGPLVARNVTANVGFFICEGLWIAFDNEVNGAQTSDTIRLSVGLPLPDLSKPLIGVIDAQGSLGSPHADRSVAVHLELTGGEAFDPDGGAPPLNGVGPRGLLVGTIDADTGCGHVTGSFSVPICTWASCID
jgi:hypothetical protein